MEHVSNCEVCGNAIFTPELAKDHFIIVKCLKCGLEFVNPRLTMFENRDFYEDSSVSYGRYLDRETFDTQIQKAVVKGILRYKQCGRFLDVGCAIGNRLQVAKDYFEIYGVEIAEWAAKYASERLGIEIWQNPIEELWLPSNFFDVITFSEVIEHLHSPAAFLREIHRILSVGGIVYLTTGNTLSLDALYWKEKWYYYAPQYHLFYFNHRNMKLLLSKTEFEILESRGSIRVLDMFDIFSAYPDIFRFLRGVVGKFSWRGFTVANMGVIARKL